jgi:hypothetical protein
MFFNGLFAFFGLIVKVGLRLCCVLVQILTFGLIRCHVDIVKILPFLFYYFCALLRNAFWTSGSASLNKLDAVERFLVALDELRLSSYELLAWSRYTKFFLYTECNFKTCRVMYVCWKWMVSFTFCPNEG